MFFSLDVVLCAGASLNFQLGPSISLMILISVDTRRYWGPLEESRLSMLRQGVNTETFQLTISER